MLPENIIFVAVLLNLVGQLWYIRGIIKGHAKPNLVSWFMWMLAPFIGVFFQLKAGVGLSVLPIFMAGFGSLTVIFVALFTKNAIWKINSFDLLCGAISLMALILYILTHNLELSIIFAILSDALAFIPTYIKSWKYPESESVAGYSWCIPANIIGLLVIKDWSFAIYSFGVYFVVANIVEILILYRKKFFKTIA
ncbi:MAG: hypothetical protein V4699_00210 [Patescibacteria group bacterium]